MLAVSDTGTGMSEGGAGAPSSPSSPPREVGQGTGLGLSQVYGFVKQSGGHVKIYSEPGQGTTVKLYLPRLDGQATEAPVAAEPETVAGGAHSEIILLVEDDPDVRAHSLEMLRELGYRVLSAADGESALGQLDSAGTIDLLFTDVGLPGRLNGRQLADEARRRRPGLQRAVHHRLCPQRHRPPRTPRPRRRADRQALHLRCARREAAAGAGDAPRVRLQPAASSTRMARKSLTLVRVGPVMTRSSSAAKNP
jgi:CheY-like chemotaxis protein